MSKPASNSIFLQSVRLGMFLWLVSLFRTVCSKWFAIRSLLPSSKLPSNFINSKTLCQSLTSRVRRIGRKKRERVDGCWCTWVAVVVTRILLLLLSSSSLLLFLLKLCVNFGQSSVRIISRFLELRDTTDALPCHIHYPLCLSIMGPHSTALKKNTSHGNGVLPQDTTHLIHRSCTNEEVRANIQQAIEPYEDLLTIVKRRKLQ